MDDSILVLVGLVIHENSALGEKGCSLCEKEQKNVDQIAYDVRGGQLVASGMCAVESFLLNNKGCEISLQRSVKG